MGMIWQRVGHIWPIYGTGMRRLDDDMELIWALFLANSELWKIYGKDSLCNLSYGKAMGMRFPWIFQSNDMFACSASSTEMIWDAHIVMFHRVSIPTDERLVQVT